MSAWKWAGLVGCVGLLGVACTKRNPAACCVAEAACNQVGLPMGSTCEGGLICIHNGCTQPDDGGVQCGMDSDCGSDAPFCADDHTCVGCLDASQCGSAAPVCDSSTHACRGCTLDSDCPSDACSIEIGSCLSADSIVYAMPMGSESSSCTQTSPCSLAKALGIATVDSTHSTLRMTAGFYNESLAVTGGGPVNIVATGASLDGDIGQDAHVGLDFEAGANVNLRGLELTPAGGSPFHCVGSNTSVVLRDVAYRGLSQFIVESCHVTLARVEVDSGLNLYNVTLTADRCQLGFAASFGIAINGVDSNTVTVTNSAVRGVDLAETGPNAILFSFDTIYGVLGVESDATLQGGITFQNNVIVDSHHTSAARCPTCVFANNVVYPQATQLTGNTILDPRLTDPANGDLHLKVGSPAIDAVDDTTNTHDLDGTSRPQGPKSDLGALEFKP